MQPEITNRKKWIRVDGTHGITWYPAQHFSMEEAATDYPGEVEEVSVSPGYGARLTMPGYMDCTDWSVHASKHEAASELLSTYFDYPDDELTEEDREWREKLEAIEGGDE